jgi:beta-lactamase superfamily II metal-dependent hydrolase
MDDKLLVRAFNVGLGDCIYVRVPDTGGAKHLLIDCGNKFGTEEDLSAAVRSLKEILPEVPGKPGVRRLDLLVATHAHEDHVRGFDPEAFDGLEIGQLWMSVAMKKDHPQAEESRALQSFALASLERLQFSSTPGMAELAESMLALSKKTGMDTLVNLPVGKRLYVHADTPAKELKVFKHPKSALKVLAPMFDVDGYYLGRGTSEALKGFRAMREKVGGFVEGAVPAAGPVTPPANVSPEDFGLLRRSLTDNCLAFVLKDGELVNNTSVVLLLEWRGRRLLFTGDAEVKTAAQGEFQKDKGNGSWNVMWHLHQDGALSKPVDFLKVGHHGSYNATPWTGKTKDGAEHPINKILDRLLPLPKDGEVPAERYALVSTARTNGYPTIPDPALMMELGKRVSNVKPYEEPTDRTPFVPAGRLQPQRTDLESADGKRVPWIDIELSPLK